jgi:GH15 family glucan-1,4-alpha-glucosidase
VFTESFGGDDVDGSLLLLHQLGFVSGRDPRFIATLDAIGRDAAPRRQPAALRRARRFSAYRRPPSPCARSGTSTRWRRRRRRSERARAVQDAASRGGPGSGLLSEDLDPDTGELWGNFPQTYSMVGLIHSAMRLSKTWDEGLWRVS